MLSMGDAPVVEFQSRNYKPSAAQEIMREEMNLAKVLESVIGVVSVDPRVQDLALDIIHGHPDLVLSLKQWQTVQTMVEAGIHRGVALRGSLLR